MLLLSGMSVPLAQLSGLPGVGVKTAMRLALNFLSKSKEEVAQGGVGELILATSATLDGEATAHFLANHYQDHEVKVSRISRGVLEDGELEYLDEYTLARALNKRLLWTRNKELLG